MAGLFCDGWDTYNTGQIFRTWTQEANGGGTGATTTVGAFGRRGTSGLRLVSGVSGARIISKTLTAADATFVIGFSLTCSALPTGVDTAETKALCRVRDNGVTQIWFRVNVDGTISAFRSTTLLGTTVANLSAGVTSYIEFKVVIHNTTGSVVGKIDGVSTILLPSGDSQNSANTSWSQAEIGSVGAGTTDFDDIYVLDGSGAENNDFLNDIRVDEVFGSSDGDHTQWTPSTGVDHFALVDDNPANDDTDFNSTATVNNKDTFDFNSAPVAGADIFFIGLTAVSRKTDAGSAGMKGMFRISGTDYLSAEKGVPSSYAALQFIFQENPNTSNPFTSGDFPLQAGYVKSA